MSPVASFVNSTTGRVKAAVHFAAADIVISKQAVLYYTFMSYMWY